MTDQQLQKLKQWFTSYIAPFYGSDQYVNANLKMKQAHTHRVCRQTRYITENLKLDENDTRIAETIALLHDVGRFEQFTRYKTYKDQESENHCLLALKIMKANNVLENLDPTERQIIENAIEFHGVIQIPADLDERTSLFAKIIRDADKLDIYHVVISEYKQYRTNPENFKREVEYTDEPHYSAKVINALLNTELINYADLRTLNDMKLMQLGWVYDVNFPETLKKIKEKGYLQQIITFLPNNQITKKITTHILEYLENRIDQPQ